MLVSRIHAALALTVIPLMIAAAGCASPQPDSDETSAGGTGEWPRTVEHAAGSTEIDTEPLTIVSTSPSLTGSLLAIDAPVTATATALPSTLVDDVGFWGVMI